MHVIDIVNFKLYQVNQCEYIFEKRLLVPRTKMQKYGVATFIRNIKDEFIHKWAEENHNFLVYNPTVDIFFFRFQ